MNVIFSPQSSLFLHFIFSIYIFNNEISFQANPKPAYLKKKRKKYKSNHILIFFPLIHNMLFLKDHVSLMLFFA